MPESDRLWLLPELGSRSLHGGAQSQVLVRPPPPPPPHTHNHGRGTTNTAAISASAIVIAVTTPKCWNGVNGENTSTPNRADQRRAPSAISYRT